MKTTQHSPLLIGLTTTLIATSLTSHAQNANTANVNTNTNTTAVSIETLDSISVTANRTEQATLEVPASIGVINEDAAQLNQANLQKDLFNSISGVRVTQTGSTIGHKTSIRMPLNTSPYYLFLQDGIPVQSSGFFNHNGLAYTNFSSAGSTEVLKGAGTALYGSDSVAGTINVISQDPTLEEGYKLKSDLGSDGFYRLGIAASKSLNSDSAIGIQLSNSGSDGWRDHTRSNRTEANITHFATINDNNSLKTVFTLNRTRADMAGSLIGLDELKNNTDSVGDIQRALDSGQEIQRKFDFARLSTEWSHFVNDDIELSTIAYYRKNRNRYVATWEKNLPQNDSQEDSLGLLLKSTIHTDRINWILGTDLEYTQANRTYEQISDYVPSGWGSAVDAGKIYDYDVDYIALSPYLSTNIVLSDSWSAEAGIRYDHNQFNYTNNLEDGQYGSSSYSRVASNNDPSFSHWSPKLSLSYHINSQQNIYARYANGFRIPQASRLYSLKTNNIDFTLDAETSDTYEVGYKLATTQQRLDLAFYHMTIDDTIVRRENDAGDRYFVNGGKTIHKGAELSLLHFLTEELSSRIAYSYSKHKFVGDDDYGNNDQAEAPNQTANLRLSFTPQKTPGLTTAIEFEHVGDYWLDNNNTTKYDSYTITHLKTLYHVSDSLQLHAKVNNLSNKVYAESASLSYGKEKYTPGSPRQFFAGLEYAF